MFKKKSPNTPIVTGKTMGMPGSIPPETTPVAPQMPMLPHQMVTAIKNSRKGQIPAGLAKYIASHKKK